MPTYPLESDKPLWDLFTDTIPRSVQINQVLVEFVKSRVADHYTAEKIEESPRFDDTHLKYFREEIEPLTEGNGG